MPIIWLFTWGVLETVEQFFPVWLKGGQIFWLCKRWLVDEVITYLDGLSAGDTGCCNKIRASVTDLQIQRVSLWRFVSRDVPTTW